MLKQEELLLILNTLYKHSEYDLRDYSPNSIFRRVNRFMMMNNMSATQLVGRLLKSGDFAREFVEALTVNTTEFFRDPPIWQFLKVTVFPDLAKRNNINIWVAGVSKGQEVYSLMVLLNEAGLLDKSHIIATDINQSVLDQAKKGGYRYHSNLDLLSNFDKVVRHNPLNYSDIKEVPLEKYFSVDKKNNRISVNKNLLRKAVFLRHDLSKDSELPFSKFDFILCRNVLIYFNREMQDRVLATFYKHMFPESFLLLGVHESIIGKQSMHFRKKGKVYMNQ